MNRGNWQMQIGRRFYLPLRSWRENHEDPAGNFGELDSFGRQVSPGVQIKKYKYGIFNDITEKSEL